jgi:DNA mismatch repair protein MutL
MALLCTSFEARLRLTPQDEVVCHVSKNQMHESCFSMPVRRLDPILVDRIAAGEVIERPAAAVKELVENALDAGARHVRVVVEAGGRKLIRVIDDGVGMSAADLALCVERHATSKLPDGDLFLIRTLGFRGEALPSIGSVARLAITTRQADAPEALQLVVEAGAKGAIRPVAAPQGTRIEVSELFAYTPARLKFLKSDRAEALAVAETLRRLALSHPQVRFTLEGDGFTPFDLPAEGDDGEALLRRLARIVGRDLPENALPVSALREGLALSGFAALPTYHRGSAASVFLSVNGRPVRDKLLLSAVRGAYADVLPSGRHPVLALALDCDPALVDVNVHPAKTELRFRDPALVRSLVVTGLREALARGAQRASSHGGMRGLEMMRGVLVGNGSPQVGQPSGFGESGQSAYAAPSAYAARPSFIRPPSGPFSDMQRPSADARATGSEPDAEATAHPLGAARAQLHETYIVAQTATGIVIVDQHAAHERIVYERLKRERAQNGVMRQMLLVPEVVELDPASVERLAAAAPVLATLGLVLEAFGSSAVLLREVPAVLSGGNMRGLVTDLADVLGHDELESGGEGEALARRLDHILATIACHHSVRAGRRMKPPEMDALLREMEITPNAGQCNHGRPTYVELQLADVERLFGRR